MLNQRRNMGNYGKIVWRHIQGERSEVYKLTKEHMNYFRYKTMKAYLIFRQGYKIGESNQGIWRGIDIKIGCHKDLKVVGSKVRPYGSSHKYSKDFSTLTKEEFQGTFESHEQIMAERAAGKSKSDVALQAQSATKKKGKGKFLDNKGK